MEVNNPEQVPFLQLHGRRGSIKPLLIENILELRLNTNTYVAELLVFTQANHITSPCDCHEPLFEIDTSFFDLLRGWLESEDRWGWQRWQVGTLSL
jgi:hypothetical protein